MPHGTRMTSLTEARQFPVNHCFLIVDIDARAVNLPFLRDYILAL